MSPSDVTHDNGDAALSNMDLCRMFVQCIKLIAERYENGSLATPFDAGSVTATDVAIVTSAMLEAVQMEVFELGLWQSWQNGNSLRD